jgi:hypothetical protein
LQYFIGLTFHPHYLQFKKIDSFRRRFDFKYNRSAILQMTLLPPFRLKTNKLSEINELFEVMEETLDGHLMDLDEASGIIFKSMEVSRGRTNVLYLKPEISPDFIHCQESLLEDLSKCGVTFNQSKLIDPCNLKTFLPLGRASLLDQIDIAVEAAHREFQLPLHLQVKHLCLFEKMPGQWIQKRKLYTFPSPKISQSWSDGDPLQI